MQKMKERYFEWLKMLQKWNLHDLLDSKIVLPCYNILDPSITLSQIRDNDTIKLYLADTGLFITRIFNSFCETSENIYTKILSDSFSADSGYLYENAVAQVIAGSNRAFYYPTWGKDGSSHYYEIDFLLASNTKIVSIEVKSSGIEKHEPITEFKKQVF